MKSKALEAFKQSLKFSSQVADAHAALWENYRNEDLEGDKWTGVQNLIMQVLTSATDLIENDPNHRSLVARESERIYSIMGSQWVKYDVQQEDGVDREFAAEFAALISCAIDVMGMPDSLYVHNLIGIAPALDQKITDHIVAYNLTGCGISISDRQYEDEYPETINHNRLNSLVSRLSETGGLSQALEVLEALSVLHASAPERWRGDALFEMGVTLFRSRHDLTDAQRDFFSDYFARLTLPRSGLDDVRGNSEHLINMARSGLEHVVEPLLSTIHERKNQFAIEKDLVFLVDIERHTSIDVRPLVQHWANLYNASDRDMQPLRIVLGYQLLTASPTIEENLIRFSTNADYQPISAMVGADLSREINPREYPVNEAHLKALVAEFMAQRPGAINDMSRDPNLHAVVVESPGWLAHRLESDLGL
ncbi:hypothetical protein [Pseudomonas sp. S1(2024)]|uniref:hypothetical protein n=1 Tax=Pseudomonas sp. S1(2024) TaxID=3390191 RepID=UPI00397AD51D